MVKSHLVFSRATQFMAEIIIVISYQLILEKFGASKIYNLIFFLKKFILLLVTLKYLCMKHYKCSFMPCNAPCNALYNLMNNCNYS